MPSLRGLLTFIPNLGPFISTIPPMLMGLAIHPWMALAVVILYIAIQQLESFSTHTFGDEATGISTACSNTDFPGNCGFVLWSFGIVFGFAAGSGGSGMAQGTTSKRYFKPLASAAPTRTNLHRYSESHYSKRHHSKRHRKKQLYP